MKPDRSFLRRLTDLPKSVNYLNHFVRLNREARSDLEWWFQFAESWNGTSLLYESHRNSCEVTIVSDASSTWGCGAIKVLPIVLAAAVRGKEWVGKSVMAVCDNAAVVASGSSRDQKVMHLESKISQFSFSSSYMKYMPLNCFPSLPPGEP